MVPENFEITINIINPDKDWFRKTIAFATTTDVSMKTLIIVKALAANFLSNLVAVLLLTAKACSHTKPISLPAFSIFFWRRMQVAKSL